MVWQFVSSLTQKLPAETAHSAAVKALSLGLAPRPSVPEIPTSIAGMRMLNPLGLAAGFDKNAEAFAGAFGLGFAMVEVGTITPLAQPGNPRPRVFRLPEDDAVINRYGFNGKGMAAAGRNLAGRKKSDGKLLGVNIGANKLSNDKTKDYFTTAYYLADKADYLTVNISSPNTPGLRDLQDGDALKATLTATCDGLKDAGVSPAIFVKLAPDMTKTALWQAMATALEFPIAGFILTNTTITRPDSLSSPHKGESGGLSGAPVRPLSEMALLHARQMLQSTKAKADLISVGGIFDARDVMMRLALGANATQLYSSLSLGGPYLPAQIVADFAHYCQVMGHDDCHSVIGLCDNLDDARAYAETASEKSRKALS